MKKVLFYLVGCYLGILAHIVFFKGTPILSREQSPKDQILRDLSNEAAGSGELSQGFEKIIQHQAKKETLPFGRADIGNYDFLYSDGDDFDSFAQSLSDYAISKEAQRELAQIDILKQIISLNKEHDSFVRVALHSLELAAQKQNEWRESDYEEIAALAKQVLEKQVSDNYELERIRNNLRSLGFQFEPTE